VPRWRGCGWGGGWLVGSAAVLFVVGGTWLTVVLWRGGATGAAQANVLAVPIGMIGIAVAFVPVVLGLRRKDRHRSRDTKRRQIERNYLELLRSTLDYEVNLQPHLLPGPGEIIKTPGLISEYVPEIPPVFRIFPVGPYRGQLGDRGKLTKNVVKYLLKSSEPVVVLGDPGSGKTVSLQQVTRRLIERELAAARPPRIPIYVRLGDFTDPLPCDREGLGRVALAFVERRLRAVGPAAQGIADALPRYLDSRRVVFLLDGMDEMQRVDYGERFDALSELRRHVGCRLLFACRKLDFRPSFPFRRCEIQPFGVAQIRAYLVTVLGKAKGRTAAAEILAPENDVLELASNPFFLKLLTHFRTTMERLPRNRAELLLVHEKTVFESAERQGGLPRARMDCGDREARRVVFRAVLARLAYLIISGRRGVTIPTEDVLRDFRPAHCSPAEESLAGYSGDLIRAVLDVAERERVISRITDSPVEGAEPAEILRFHHHRLQEYYAATYLHEFRPEVDWRQHWDDIWWQETLVMLAGIAEESADAQAPLGDLLASLPEKVVMCESLGPALAKIIDPPSTGTDDAAPIETLRELDPSDHYGLRSLAETLETSETPLRESLVPVGLLRSEAAAVEAAAHLRELKPEADDDQDAEQVRRWLEDRNAVVLDRIELTVECGRNAGQSNRTVAERVAPLLSTFSRQGNTVEAVRAVRASTRLGEDRAVEIAEWSLLHRSAWCRRESLDAITSQPLGRGGSWRWVTAVVFIQFLKGELVTGLPQLWRSVRQRYHPGVLAYGGVLIAGLLAVSLAGFVSPASVYLVLTSRYPQGAFGLNGALGHPWKWWAFALTVAFCLWVYFTRIVWKTPILHSMAFMAVPLFFAPFVVALFERVDWDYYRSPHRAAGHAPVWLPADMLTAVLGALALVAVPQVVQGIGVLAAAVPWGILTRSWGVVRGAVVFVRQELYRSWTYLKVIQLCLAICGAMALVPLLIVVVPSSIPWLGVILAIVFVALWCAGGLLLLWKVVTTALQVLREGRTRQVLRDCVIWLAAMVIISVLLSAGIWAIIRLGRLLWHTAGPVVLVVLSIAASVGVMVYVLRALNREVVRPIAWRIGRVLSDLPVARRLVRFLGWRDLRDDDGVQPRSAQVEYDQLRGVVGRLRTQAERNWADQKLLRLQKESRQEKARQP
jgi:hypothetical protein